MFTNSKILALPLCLCLLYSIESADAGTSASPPPQSAQAVLTPPPSAAPSSPICLDEVRLRDASTQFYQNNISEEELLARTIYSENVGAAHFPNSLGFNSPSNNSKCVSGVAERSEAIGWLIRNRGELGKADPNLKRYFGNNISSTILSKHQFSAVVDRSGKLSDDFRCPRANSETWKKALAAAHKVLSSPLSDNPLLMTNEEKKKGYSRVTNYVYAGFTPVWAKNQDVVENIPNVKTDCIVFYRMNDIHLPQSAKLVVSTPPPSTTNMLDTVQVDPPPAEAYKEPAIDPKE